MYRLATCFWVSGCMLSTGFVGCAVKIKKFSGVNIALPSGVKHARLFQCESVGLFSEICPFNSYSLLSIYAIDAKCSFFLLKNAKKTVDFLHFFISLPCHIVVIGFVGRHTGKRLALFRNIGEIATLIKLQLALTE